MPGLVGFTRGAEGGGECAARLDAMARLVTHRGFHRRDGALCTPLACGTRVHTGILQPDAQPGGRDGVSVWLDGELFHLPGEGGRGHAAAFAAMYAADPGMGFLRGLDGIYAAVVLDAPRRRLHLVTDRYGLRHLAWARAGTGLAWASETKALLALPGVDTGLDPRALEEFFAVGYLLENRTWLRGVSLVPPASVLTWDFDACGGTTRRYWWWGDIAAAAAPVDERAAAEELGRLFVRAVDARAGGDVPAGVLLSGGLDSRAVLAAMPDRPGPPPAVTFGDPRSDDATLAARAAAVRGAPHQVVAIDAANWLTHRAEGVWLTDGHLDLMHMHGAETVPRIRERFRINMSGFAGDLILGGSALGGRIGAFDRDFVARRMACARDLVDPQGRYAGLRSSDFYFLDNRVRRFTVAGLQLGRWGVEHRLPFFDNALLEFAYSLPDALRVHSHLYNRMLLARFPQYYRTIPWQKTGVPITWSPRLVTAVSTLRKVRYKVRSRLARAGIHLRSTQEFADYAAFVRREPARALFAELLLSPGARVRGLVGGDRLDDAWRRHAAGENHASFLCRAATVEIWLRRVDEARAAVAGPPS